MPAFDPHKRIKELEAALLAARGGVEDTLKTLQARLEETRAEKATFEKTSAQRAKERNEARKERDALKAQVEDLEKKVAARPAAAAPAPPPRKSATDEDVERLEAKVSKLERELDLAQSSRGGAGPTNEDLEAALAHEREQNAPLREEAARWKGRVQTLEAEVKSLRVQGPTMPSNKGREAHADETEKLHAKIAELERQLELSHQGEPASADERIQALEAQLAEAREAAAPALEELAKAKERIRVLERQIEAMRPAPNPLPVSGGASSEGS